MADLTDYHRQLIPPCRPLVPELVEDGRLLEVEVEGWDKTGYMAPDATIPRRVLARALLSPFDPVVWNRDRTERLFGFRYRIEIYVPKPKRQFGYYVLPFLLGDQIVGRVDLKADRARAPSGATRLGRARRVAGRRCGATLRRARSDGGLARARLRRRGRRRRSQPGTVGSPRGALSAHRNVRVMASPAGRTISASVTGRYGRRRGRRAQRGSSATAAPAMSP